MRAPLGPHLLMRGKHGSRDDVGGGGNGVDPRRRRETLLGLRSRRDADGPHVSSGRAADRTRRAVRSPPPRSRPEGLHPDRDAGEGRDAPAPSAPSQGSVREAGGEPRVASRHDPDDRVLRRSLELGRLFRSPDPVRGVNRPWDPVLKPPTPHDPRLPRDGSLPRREAVQGPGVPTVLSAIPPAARDFWSVHQHAGPDSESAGAPRYRRVGCPPLGPDRPPLGPPWGCPPFGGGWGVWRGGGGGGPPCSVSFVLPPLFFPPPHARPL